MLLRNKYGGWFELDDDKIDTNKIMNNKIKIDYMERKFFKFEPSTAKDFEEIANKYFDNASSNDALNEYVKETSNMAKRIERNEEFKRKMDKLEPLVDQVSVKAKYDMVLYSAKDASKDYSQHSHLLSATISKQIAKLYSISDRDKQIITFYVRSGSSIIPTNKTENRHFYKQGEVIFPTNSKIERIDSTHYIVTK